jgi:hypothetical protein
VCLRVRELFALNLEKNNSTAGRLLLQPADFFITILLQHFNILVTAQ